MAEKKNTVNQAVLKEEATAAAENIRLEDREEIFIERAAANEEPNLFVGINGVDEQFGFSTPRYADADIKNDILHSAHCSIILADHTKLGKTFLAHVDAPNYLITDEMVTGFAYEGLTGTTVIFANETKRMESETC